MVYYVPRIKTKKKIDHYNIANKEIQGRRSEMDVICNEQNHGKVHDFVPFYFSTKNSMQLSIINQKKVDQSELIFLGVKTELIKTHKLIFTDSSANALKAPNFYNNYDDLSKLDWETINSLKWRLTDQQKQKRMAEVLIKDFKFEYVDHIIVSNEDTKNKVKNIMENNNLNNPPQLCYDGFGGKYFYFTKFFFKGRKNEDLVTGPRELLEVYSKLTQQTIEERKAIINFKHKLLNNLLQSIDQKFDCIPELSGIYKLETLNEIHSNSVSDHTLDVVKNLQSIPEFLNLDLRLQEILRLAAYLHDIGKGPKSKWRYGKQEAYNDHPYDSLLNSQRVLIEEIQELTNEEIRLINMLVTYHDILGDLTKGHRNTIELKNIITSHQDLELLYILSQADVLALNKEWYNNLCSKFEEIKNKVLG